MFAVVRIADAWKQDLVQKAVAEAEKGKNEKLVDEAQKKFGLGPADIDKVLYVLLDHKTEKMYVVVNTNKAFDKAKLTKEMDLDSAEQKHQNKAYQKEKGGRTAVHFGSDKMMIFAPNEDSMKAALDQLTGNRKATAGKIASVLGRSGGSQHVIVGFGVPSEVAAMAKGGGKGAPGMPDFGPLAEMQAGAMTVNLSGSSVQFDFSGEFPDSTKADQAKKAMDGLKGAVALFAPPGPMSAPVKEIANALSISQSGSTVKVSVSRTFKPEEIAGVLQMGQMFGGMGGGPGQDRAPGSMDQSVVANSTSPTSTWSRARARPRSLASWASRRRPDRLVRARKWQPGSSRGNRSRSNSPTGTGPRSLRPSASEPSIPPQRSSWNA